MNKNFLKFWISVSKFPLLIIGSSQYILGVGIFYYLGGNINLIYLLQGLIFIWFMQLGANYLFFIFKPKSIASIHPIKFFSYIQPSKKAKLFLGRNQLLFLTIAMFGGALIIFYQWIILNNSLQLIYLHGAIILISIFLLIIPPFSLLNSGYGELVVSFLYSIIVPSFGFLLQEGNTHRLISFAGLPIFFMMVSTMLVLQFPKYRLLINKNNNNLLQSIGWEDGFVWNEVLITISFTLLIASIRIGLPTRIGLPIFLTLPVSLALMWLMRKVRNGDKPNWLQISLLALGNLSFMSYLFIYSFWIL